MVIKQQQRDSTFVGKGYGYPSFMQYDILSKSSLLTLPMSHAVG